MDNRTIPDLFILRHGETEWNRDGRYQGWLDSPLTDTGEAQAQAMGHALAARGIGPESHDVRVSPSGRTRATATLAFPGVAFEVCDDLKEIDMGSWSGLTRDDVRQKGVIPDDLTMLEFYAAVPDGESFQGLWDRAGRVLAGLWRPSVLVTHGMTSRFLRTRALGLGMERLSDVDGGQGVIFHLTRGAVHRIDPVTD